MNKELELQNDRIETAADNWFNPVSYTHLDVYKRQFHIHAQITGSAIFVNK